ncbi:MAG: hypothetical protein JRJ43_03610 [Deltaproteobacteria bacterium]|nr:hypothetical protein [Deltaproteobacteria bacterium]MBW1718638.1 hypothetical protein [Deltaproteobacteria bacterium]MBW1932910.1 hypothetical protein [Deltaproteobacteria bacterium]MBW1938566.1 hypothetical protein [Deltaproteobacteria bacterium]MBW1964142.1 hypothetical protein [Deltaproteobacteria bacterium]
MQKKGLKVVFIFIGAYLIFLILWINVKDYYGYAITYPVSNMVVLIKDVMLESITEKGDKIEVAFCKHIYRGEITAHIAINTSFYAFNVPLTCAILAAFYLFIKRKKRAYLEAVLILLFVHALYVFSLEAKGLTETFMGRGIEPMNKVKLAFYQFLWSFTDNMVIRFEPFLIGIYVFLRFRK